MVGLPEDAAGRDRRRNPKLTEREEFIMDLALEMGRTVEWVESHLTEAELLRWRVYDRRKRLPTRRLEVYLARIAHMLSSGKHSLDDFILFKRPPVVDETVPTVAEATNVINAVFGGGMKFFKLGQRKVIPRG